MWKTAGGLVDDSSHGSGMLHWGCLPLSTAVWPPECSCSLRGPVAAGRPRQGLLSSYQLWLRERALSPCLCPLFVVFSILLLFFFLIYISVSRHSVISLFIKVQSYRVFINFILQSFALPQYTQASQYFSRGRLSGYTVSCPSCDGRGSKMRGLNLASWRVLP